MLSIQLIDPVKPLSSRSEGAAKLTGKPLAGARGLNAVAFQRRTELWTVRDWVRLAFRYNANGLGGSIASP